MNDESQHLIISGVPSLGLQDELRRLCCRFGDVKSLVYIPNYDTEKFVEAYHVNFSRVQSSRHAKRHIDGRAFFGGSLHVCYAPEMESISETRCKLIQRRHEVTRRSVANETTRSSNLPEVGKTVTSGITRGTGPYAVTNRCIWNGKEISSDPRILAPAKELERASSAIYGPQPRTHDWSDVGVREVVMTPLLPKSSPIPKKQISKQLQLSMTVHKPGTQSETVIKTVPPILKLIPSQVKSAHKKIIFHPKSNTNLGVSTGDQSLDSTISKVREKIRSVTVPNIKIMLEKNL